jgi:uncharacterized protein YdeI (YjbR/CyaY-like superfamily)
MSEHIRKLIDAIEAGKSTDIQDNFEAAIAEKLHAAIEDRKEQIAAGLLDTQPEQEEVADDEVEQVEDQTEEETDDSHGL